jgi:hypothetical protein
MQMSRGGEETNSLVALVYVPKKSGFCSNFLKALVTKVYRPNFENRV